VSPELAARLSPEDLADIASGDLSLETVQAFAQLPQVIPPAGEVARYDPAAGAKQILALGALESAAKRAKNPDALEKAIAAKLEAQRDFAADFRGRYVQGKHTDSYDRSVVRADAHCQQFGFHIRTVQRWAERLLDPAAFTAEYRERMKKVWSVVEMAQAANFSSESVEWYTPARYIEAAREALGGIDLDPASCAQANETVQAAEFFTQEQDGLGREWKGRVFLNPPYGKDQENGSLAAAFCNKAIAEYENGNLDACVILVNSVHSQKWQAPLFKFVICFVDHRIQFVSADGEKNDGPTFMNMFVYLGPDPKRFACVFDPFGYVDPPWGKRR